MVYRAIETWPWCEMMKSMSFLPLRILVNVDAVLITLTIFDKLRTRYIKRGTKGPRVNKKALLARGAGRFHGNAYQELEGNNGFDGNDHQMESRIVSMPRRPTGFEQLGTSEAAFLFQDQLKQDDGSQKTDLHHFVESLSKCRYATKVGLSVEFQDLASKPPKLNRKILSEDSGTINGGSLWGVIQKYLGYVPQDDIVLSELTVPEDILHSARIRLPCTWSDNEIQDHVDILRQSSLEDRKRVSVGMELAAAPMALFLHEPTSGLDAAAAAASIMSTRKALSRLGMTIVTIIHQPRQEDFESLNSLVLLGQGRMIYCDVMGDTIAGEGRNYKRPGDTSVEGLIQYWSTGQNDSLAPKQDEIRLVSMIETSSLAKTVKTRGAQWYKQIYFCFTRSFLQQYRMQSPFYFEIGVGALAGFLIGLSQLSQNGQNFRDYASVPQTPLLVGLAVGLTTSAPGVKIFGEDELFYWREAAAGYKRFGKVLSTFPRMILASFHFTTLFMLLTSPRITYISSFVTNMLHFYCIYGLASDISMIARREDGPLLAIMMSLIVGVLNGMSPLLKKVRL
ncbi:hypothetical protein BKA61DRAFT_722725 [Leptodontidium sp. MPI-SDFR-AT-0119]|nr:hypothetical protein BKA61DRAFT_722725 [Leptodontidium sp. MPI-SDFR-AT-0119]